MNNDLPKSLQKWSETRRQGKWRYVLINGVLGWGVPMFVVMTFVVGRRPEVPITASRIAVSAILWLLGGLLFGLASWASFERKYRKHASSQSDLE